VSGERVPFERPHDGTDHRTEYASATGRPEVLWTDGNSSLLSYLPHDPSAGLSSTLTFTGSNGSLVFL
jgi:hypothetical protein